MNLPPAKRTFSELEKSSPSPDQPNPSEPPVSSSPPPQPISALPNNTPENPPNTTHEKEKEKEKEPSPPSPKRSRSEPNPPARGIDDWSLLPDSSSILTQALQAEQTHIANIKAAEDAPLWLYQGNEYQVEKEKSHPVVIITNLKKTLFPELKDAGKTFGKLNLELSSLNPEQQWAILVFKNLGEAENARKTIHEILKEGIPQPSIETLTEYEIAHGKFVAFFNLKGVNIEEVRAKVPFPTKTIRINSKNTVSIWFFSEAHLLIWLRSPVYIGSHKLNKKASFLNKKTFDLFASNIPPNFTATMVRKILDGSPFEVSKVKIIRDTRTNKSKGCAIVKFPTIEDRITAYTKSTCIEGRFIKWKRCAPKKLVQENDTNN